MYTLTFLISVHVRLFILTWISKLFTLIRELYVYFSGEHFWADRLFWISSTFWMSTYVNFIHFEDLKRYVKTINPWCTIIWNVAKLYDYLLVHISPSCTIIQGCTLIRNVRVVGWMWYEFLPFSLTCQTRSKLGSKVQYMHKSYSTVKIPQ